MNIFLVLPTMRCQLQCKYCHFTWHKEGGGYIWTGYQKAHEIKREMDAQELLVALAPFAPYHVEFTGGEPLLWDGFVEFVAHVPEGSQWAITSNSLLAKTREIDLSRCTNWTASYHETAIDKFVDNLIALRERFPHIAVSQVVRKETVYACLEKAELFSALGFQPNLLRELNPGVSWDGSPEWAQLVESRKLGYNVVEDDIPPDYTFESGFLCEGGHNYFAIMPDGKVYKCYSEAMHENPVGTLADFKAGEAASDCHAECLGCALDHRARVKKLEAV